MDLLSLFSPEELSTWADKRFVGNMLYLTGKILSLGFYLTVLWVGLHVALRDKCQAMADWLYLRPGLKAAGQRLPVLRRMVNIPERMAAGKEGIGNNRWLVDALLPAFFAIFWVALTLPMSFYSSYIRPHAVGMSNLALSQWFIDVGKSLGFTLLALSLLGLSLFSLARRLPRTWWLWLWGAVVGGLVVWNMLAPYRAMIYNEFTPLPQGELRTRIEALVEKAGFELEQIQVVNTSLRSKATVAYIMGKGPTRTVVLSDNLLNEYPTREVLFTVAHEMGHELNAHETRAWLSLALAAFLFLGMIQLIIRYGPRWKKLRIRPGVDPAIWPVIQLIFFFLFTLNIPVTRTLSRAEEWEADKSGLELTRDPVAYVSLMARLTRQNKADPHPPWFVRKVLGSHPSLKERMEYGLEWARRHNIPIGLGALPLPAPKTQLIKTDANQNHSKEEARMIPS